MTNLTALEQNIKARFADDYFGDRAQGEGRNTDMFRQAISDVGHLLAVVDGLRRELSTVATAGGAALQQLYDGAQREVIPSNPRVSGERFVTAWINLDQFPGSMYTSSHGGKFGPVAAMTGCLITTDPNHVEEWKRQGKPVMEIAAVETKTEPAYTEKDVAAIVAAVDAVRATKAVTPLTLRDFGFAPGNYSSICFACGAEFIGDKRAIQCEPCAGKKLARSSEKSEGEPK